MGNCKYCGCSGWFFALTKSGLCANCNHIIGMEIAQHREALRSSSEQADRTTNPQSKIARLDQALASLEALAKIEERGIPTLEGSSPSAMLRARQADRDALILGTALQEVSEAMANIQAAEGPERKMSIYSNLLLKLSEHKTKASDKGPLDALERKVKDSVYQIQLNTYLEMAKEAELRREDQKALKLYLEAVAYLKAVDMDPALRTQHVAKLNGKVKELRSKSG